LESAPEEAFTLEPSSVDISETLEYVVCIRDVGGW
jgi:hypothetical protein